MIEGFFYHIFEAVFINLRRMPLYAMETGGRSLPTSIFLIGFEISILPLAIFYDLTTSDWRRRGIPIMVDDFIPMNQTPAFQKNDHKASHIPLRSFKWEPVQIWRNTTTQFLWRGEWEEAYKQLESIRDQLDLSMHPLTHHFLESVHRAIALTIIWEEKIAGGEKFFKHRRWFIHWQMVGYEGAMILDWLSWKIRQRGCGILVKDVPVIPVPKITKIKG